MTEHHSLSKSLPPLAIAILLAWFSLVAWLALTDVFAAGPGELPWKFLLAIILPIPIFGLALRLSSGFRAYVLGLSLPLLTGLHSWRMIGFAFLVLYAWDLLPPLFAYPAGIGDVLISIAAPFYVAAFFTTRGVSRRSLVLWNWLGILDFVVAVSTGMLASSSALGLLAGAVTTAPVLSLPLVLIPTFAVPFLTLLHYASLVQLAQAKESQITARSLPAAA